MRRRDLCIAISVLPMAFATKARAQGGPLRVGWVSTERSTVPSPFLEALRQGLRELGYIEGRNLVLMSGGEGLDRASPAWREGRHTGDRATKRVRTGTDMKAGKALGLTVPSPLLLRINEVLR